MDCCQNIRASDSLFVNLSHKSLIDLNKWNLGSVPHFVCLNFVTMTRKKKAVKCLLRQFRMSSPFSTWLSLKLGKNFRIWQRHPGYIPVHLQDLLRRFWVGFNKVHTFHMVNVLSTRQWHIGKVLKQDRRLSHLQFAACKGVRLPSSLKLSSLL